MISSRPVQGGEKVREDVYEGLTGKGGGSDMTDTESRHEGKSPLNTRRITKRLQKRFGGVIRLVNDEIDIINLVLPMVPEFLERMGYPELLPEVAGLIRDTDTIHTFVAFSDGKAVGFSTYMASYMPRNSTLHQWHLFVKRRYRHLTHMFYDLTTLLMEELDVDNLSFITFNSRLGTHGVKEYEKRGIHVKLTGYFYRSFHNVDKRKYKALARDLRKLHEEPEGS